MIDEYSSFYLVGIKGVAMTALAQCLVDAGKKVAGCDVAEAFVTQPLLDRLRVSIDKGFTHPLPTDVECVIYTAAHQGQYNPLVQAARNQHIPCLSHAEALADLFNEKQGIAVCGVGGKSTTSAMIAWILSYWQNPAQADPEVSFAVGVGNIPGLNKTGQWSATGPYFVAEADEYVIDPSAPSRGEPITPRFSFMKPTLTVCTNLSFDHPDVYKNFDHTLETFGTFFRQIKPGGTLVTAVTNQPYIEKMQTQHQVTARVVYYGDDDTAEVKLTTYASEAGLTTATVVHQQQEYTLQLNVPGKFNVLNAVAALTVAQKVGIPLTQACAALATFHSTQRRSEFMGEKKGVKYYDDYAHHPNEVQNIIHAFKEWFPHQKLVVAFQSHTFSRTKALFTEFVSAFAEADQVVMIDIFPSAREAFDSSITSDMLCQAITTRYPHMSAQNLKTLPALAEWCVTHLQPGDICLTVGAGDIYHLHDLV